MDSTVPVPATSIKITTDVPRDSAADDEWSFDFIVFYAHDRHRIPPRDWHRRNHNEWFMFIHEHIKDTNKKRIIHVAPDFTVDGQIKGIHLALHPANAPIVPPLTAQQFKVEEWPLKLDNSKVAAYGAFYHIAFLKLIKERQWKETYLYGILPFDTNQFCMNFAHYFHRMGLIDESDIRYLTNLMKTPWPRPDGSSLPYQI